MDEPSSTLGREGDDLRHLLTKDRRGELSPCMNSKEIRGRQGASLTDERREDLAKRRRREGRSGTIEKDWRANRSGGAPSERNEAALRRKEAGRHPLSRDRNHSNEESGRGRFLSIQFVKMTQLKDEKNYYFGICLQGTKDW